MTGEGRPIILMADGRALRRSDSPAVVLPFPGGPSATPPTPHGIRSVDLNSDYRMDVVLAGAGGLRFLLQGADGSFADTTAATKLDAKTLGSNAFGAWAADIEMDGDLDPIVAAREGPPIVLRNNGDGTFNVVQPFSGAADLRDFAWADLDQDGDPDAAFVDAKGALLVYTKAGPVGRAPGRAAEPRALPPWPSPISMATWMELLVPPTGSSFVWRTRKRARLGSGRDRPRASVDCRAPGRGSRQQLKPGPDRCLGVRRLDRPE